MRAGSAPWTAPQGTNHKSPPKTCSVLGSYTLLFFKHSHHSHDDIRFRSRHLNKHQNIVVDQLGVACNQPNNSKTEKRAYSIKKI